jgi:hypothetical protein
MLQDNAIVPVVSDLHGMSTVGLMPPSWRTDDGQTVLQSQVQAWLWGKWTGYWGIIAAEKERTGYPVVAVVNGETVDKNWHPTVQQLTEFEPTLIDAAVDILAPAMAVADYFLFTRGTEAHVGLGGALDELVARRIAEHKGIHVIRNREGAYSWLWFWGKFGGVSMDIAHHPGHGYMREWTAGGDANRLAASILMRYAKLELPCPKITWRGHNHKPTDSADNYPTRAVITPSWQLATHFGHRIGGGFLPVGGAYTVCRHGSYDDTIRKVYSEWPITVDDCWTPDMLSDAVVEMAEGGRTAVAREADQPDTTPGKVRGFIGRLRG